MCKQAAAAVAPPVLRLKPAAAATLPAAAVILPAAAVRLPAVHASPPPDAAGREQVLQQLLLLQFHLFVAAADAQAAKAAAENPVQQ